MAVSPPSIGMTAPVMTARSLQFSHGPGCTHLWNDRSTFADGTRESGSGHGRAPSHEQRPRRSAAAPRRDRGDHAEGRLRRGQLPKRRRRRRHQRAAGPLLLPDDRRPLRRACCSDGPGATSNGWPRRWRPTSRCARGGSWRRTLGAPHSSSSCWRPPTTAPRCKAEVGAVARESGAMQMERLDTLLGEYGIDPDEFPPALRRRRDAGTRVQRGAGPGRRLRHRSRRGRRGHGPVRRAPRRTTSHRSGR